MITLESPKEIVLKEEKKITVSSVSDPMLIDFESTVIAKFNCYDSNGKGMGRKELILWEGDSYVTIGDWTQQQAIDKIIELL